MSYDQYWDVHKREEVFRIVNLILRSIQAFVRGNITLGLLISEDVYQLVLDVLLLAGYVVDCVEHGVFAAEAHVGLDDESQHLSMDV